MTNAISTIETLTDTAVDSALGYETAAEKAKNPGLKQTLHEQAAKRRETVRMLNDEIVRLGGNRHENGSTMGAAHRAFTSLADAFQDSNKSAAERVEEGEDYIAKKFREALEHAELTPETRSVVERAHAEISAGERLADRLEKQFD
ncbi:PA2169 family four-helix-bundle protein [Aurantimonas sp. C2-6-R+9]|uniref:PA2169 family four-helix-bundle protein n=1 Tax=unclassified Aurantimonas TaxID=2638230 RepID=UPI002E16F8E0|nr:MULTISPECIES: PA2169 family four-helix-bundle protein [unclassified Aurantimonas]MEC5291153.1 PA2169 family four-helix-bundle protein [Aurantimonas sp. C2-3-R2]MEC5324188.1 PA2169 family four-helix-bundle protein [Aurantimonas sp. A3-2-R12]MEC5381480.1 PA2169 family four-helix-bundle protein [Aurantimonas sp. C2-6-R+9]MEC5411885.1 PA2169 family four-helix-bundle protein [Aurantimonas sp. C2-4-R8]